MLLNALHVATPVTKPSRKQQPSILSTEKLPLDYPDKSLQLQFFGAKTSLFFRTSTLPQEFTFVT